MTRFKQKTKGFIFSRRAWLLAASLWGVSSLLAPLARAKKPEAIEAMEKITGSAVAKDGRVNLIIPPLVESGNLVVLKVIVESPMTASDYVKSVHIIAEANPLPNIFSAFFTPRSGTATVTTRVRLADSQRVWAIAQMSDGSFWQGYADTLVTLSACTEMI